MSAIDDATTIFEKTYGRTFTGPQLVRIADRFYEVNPFGFPIVESPTNEEKAQLFIRTLRHYFRVILEHKGRAEGEETAEATVQSAIDDALTDVSGPVTGTAISILSIIDQQATATHVGP